MPFTLSVLIRFIQIKAVSNVLCYLLPSNELLALLIHSAFNYALIKEFKYNQKLFRSLEAFITHVSSAFASGIIFFEEILTKYCRVCAPNDIQYMLSLI